MLIFEHEKYFSYVDIFFDDEIIFEVLLKIKTQSHKYSSNNWENYLTNDKDSKEIKIWTHDQFSESLKSYLSIVVGEKFPVLRSDKILLNFQITEWQKGSYITFHNDWNKEFALTCYLDNQCEGGIFSFKENKDSTVGTFLLPVKNRCVMIKNLQHSVTPVIKGTRTTLQIWGSKVDAVL